MKIQLRILKTWLTTATCAAGLYILPAFAQEPPIIPGPGHTNTVGFNNLTGANGDAFSTYTEGEFTISSDAGSWFKAFVYGSPIPDILLGPAQHPLTGVLRIIDSSDRFNFTGFDFSSNNGDSNFEVEGFLGLTKIFDETGSLTTPNFQTYSSLSPTAEIDSLLIHIFPGAFTTTVNIDNIRVTSIPEASSVSLLVLGIFSLVASRRVGGR
jgi:hypothetical protein